jgi:arylsulfatase A-like enzyme
MKTPLLLILYLSIIFLPSRKLIAADRPNILFILVDDLGYGDLSCQGADDLQTPHIDNLMAEGIAFTNFYANSTVCSPTRASLMTGRYPDLVGVPGVIRHYPEGNFGYLSEIAVLLPELLKKTGYRTALIGKWHLGVESPNLPNDRGFDLYKGHLAGMMDDYYTHRYFGEIFLRENRQPVNPEGHATEIFTTWAVDYLKEQQENEVPFFLYLAYTAPHDPIQPPEDWLRKVIAREQEIDSARAGIVALIEHLDDNIGLVLATLKSMNLEKNTVVIFASDNGGALRFGANNGSLRGGKQDLYEGGIKVPACMKWPGKIKPGISSEEMILMMDFYPTLASMGGAAISHPVDGTDLWPSISAQRKIPDRDVLWMRREGWAYGGQIYYAVRHRNFKLVQNTPFENYQLFDLDNDPAEQHPLPESHEMFGSLKNKLREHIQQAGAVPWQKEN